MVYSKLASSARASLAAYLPGIISWLYIILFRIREERSCCSRAMVEMYKPSAFVYSEQVEILLEHHPSLARKLSLEKYNDGTVLCLWMGPGHVNMGPGHVRGHRAGVSLTAASAVPNSFVQHTFQFMRYALLHCSLQETMAWTKCETVLCYKECLTLGDFKIFWMLSWGACRHGLPKTRGVPDFHAVRLKESR